MTFERWFCVATFAINLFWFAHSTWNTRYVRRVVRRCEAKLDVALGLSDTLDQDDLW